MTDRQTTRAQLEHAWEENDELIATNERLRKENRERLESIRKLTAEIERIKGW